MIIPEIFGLLKKLSIFTGLSDLALIDSVYFTKKLIGFKIYLLRKTEKIKIANANTKTVNLQEHMFATSF